jgi:hypothetical protein
MRRASGQSNATASRTLQLRNKRSVRGVKKLNAGLSRSVCFNRLPEQQLSPLPTPDKFSRSYRLSRLLGRLALAASFSFGFSHGSYAAENIYVQTSGGQTTPINDILFADNDGSDIYLAPSYLQGNIAALTLQAINYIATYESVSITSGFPHILDSGGDIFISGTFSTNSDLTLNADADSSGSAATNAAASDRDGLINAESGALIVSGATTLTAGDGIAATNASNDFGGAVTATTNSGDIALVDVNDIVLGNIGASNVTVTATDVDISGTSLGAANTFAFVNSAGDAVQIGGTTSAAIGTFDLSMSELNSILTQNLQFESKGGDITVDGVSLTTNLILDASGTPEPGAVSFGSTSSTIESLDVKASSSISQSGSINITGSTTLNSDGNINLSNAANSFGSTVTASAVDITLVDSGSILLGDIDASGNVTLVASAGSITDNGAGNDVDTDINVTGTTSLSAMNGNIELDDEYNNFGGAVSAQTNSGSITLRDVDNISLGDIDATGNLTVVASGGTITDNGNGSSGSDINVTGTTSLSAANGITLDDTFNDFGGAVDASTVSGDITLYDVNDITLGSVSGTNVTVTATDIDTTVGKTVAGTNSLTFINSGANNVLIGDPATSTSVTFDITSDDLTNLETSELIIDSQDGNIATAEVLLHASPIGKLTLKAGTGSVEFQSKDFAVKALEVASSSSISQLAEIASEGLLSLNATGNIDLSSAYNFWRHYSHRC